MSHDNIHNNLHGTVYVVQYIHVYVIHSTVLCSSARCDTTTIVYRP